MDRGQLYFVVAVGGALFSSFFYSRAVPAAVNERCCPLCVQVTSAVAGVFSDELNDLHIAKNAKAEPSCHSTSSVVSCQSCVCMCVSVCVFCFFHFFSLPAHANQA